MRKIFFDIETKNTFEEANSSEPRDLDLSVVCIYDSFTDSFSSYLEKDLYKLWPIIESADMFITFNGDHFDIPILAKYYSGDLSKIKSLDILVEVKKSLGRRLKLDTIAEATLGTNKIGNGMDAIIWWRSGEIDKIIKYCIEDVKITRDVYDFALKNGFLKYKDSGIVKQIKLDTSDWEKVVDNVVMNCTLPF